MFGNVQTKLTYRLTEYILPEGLAFVDVDKNCWRVRQGGQGLPMRKYESEPVFFNGVKRLLIGERVGLRRRMAFAELANDFEQRLHGISSELTNIEGSLEVCGIRLCSRLAIDMRT